jgi:hypothetical protein
MFFNNKIKPLHISATTGHHQKAQPTLQRKRFTCITCKCGLVGVPTLVFKILFLKQTEFSIEWYLAVKPIDGGVPSQ